MIQNRKENDMALSSRMRCKARYYYRHRTGKLKTGRWWSAIEIGKIMARHINDVAMSVQLGRSVQSIQVKRCKIKTGRRLLLALS